MKKIIYIGIMIIAGCNGAYDTIQPTSGITRKVLIDDGPPLSQIFYIESIGGDSLIALDDFAQVQLYVDNKFYKSIGIHGRGPCEYNAVRHISLNGDTLFILDPSTAKIVYYSLTTDECLGELILPELSDFSSFVRFGGSYYLLHTGYSVATNLNKRLFFRLDDDMSLTALGIRFADIQANVMLPPIQKYVSMRTKDDIIYMEFPLTDKLWLYNTGNGRIGSFELSLDGFDREFKSVSDPDEIMRVFNEVIELISGLYMLEDKIAVISGNGTYPDRTIKIRFLTYEGRPLGEITTDLYVFRVTERIFSRLTEESDDPDARHPYIIIDQEYHIHTGLN
jgi:hypothetical protein